MSRIAIATLGLVVLTACSPKPVDRAETAPSPAASAPVEQSAADAEWARLEDRYLTMPDAPTAPMDALEWREVHCNFLAGELGGDTEQDAPVSERIDDLGCGGQRADAQALRTASAGDAALLARIDAFLSRHPS